MLETHDNEKHDDKLILKIFGINQKCFLLLLPPEEHRYDVRRKKRPRKENKLTN